VLKAYYNNQQQIILKSGNKSKTFPFSMFEDSMFLDGLYCTKDLCELSSVSLNGASVEADQIFVNAWRESVDPSYRSPYGKRVLWANSTDVDYDVKVRD